MRIGITYDLKSDALPPLGAPDDYQEEFDSPATVEAVAAVLRDLGHDIVKLGDGREMLQSLLADPPDFVFNFAEGQGIGRSREARVPAVLEMLGIPHTGSDPLTLAATLDKDCAKRLVQSAGGQVPRWTVIQPTDDISELTTESWLPYTAIVKPAWEGSSKGIRGRCVVDDAASCVAAVEAVRRDQLQPVLVEEYIEGDELTVGVIGNDPARIIGVMRVLPKRQTDRFIYSLEVKRDWRNQVRYECPALLQSNQVQAVEQAALLAYRALGCRDIARVDFRLRGGIPYFLEVNPLPGLNPDTGDVVIMARLSGWTYDQLIGGIFEAAVDRCNHTMHSVIAT
ncbi:MAG TPA: ATP-grasp domain-containing protein [Gemmataceae bacterium]|nr:ATP-grasp domain-containing protein [Gemmataceae bacterium]